MERKYIDCREYPGSNCTVTLSADSESELMEAAISHGVQVHGFSDNAETRESVRKAFKSGCQC